MGVMDKDMGIVETDMGIVDRYGYGKISNLYIGEIWIYNMGKGYWNRDIWEVEEV